MASREQRLKKKKLCSNGVDLVILQHHFSFILNGYNFEKQALVLFLFFPFFPLIWLCDLMD